MSQDASNGHVSEVFTAFLKLGLTSFGGPIAHLGYFRDELVVRRKWLDETAYADLVALCQFLPGPASSQVGFSLGILRGNGLLGGLAAWFAFTMPSALILFAFAMGASAFTGPVAEGFLHGLKLVAVAVVAQAIWGMSRTLTPDRARAGIALGAVAIVVLFVGSFGQIAAIALGACAGLWLCRGEVAPVSGHLNFPVTPAGRCDRTRSLRGTSVDPSGDRRGDKLSGSRLVRRVLQVGRIRLRRRPCRAASASGSSRYARMGHQRGIPGRLWTGAGGAGTALHLCRLSRGSDGTSAERSFRRSHCPCRAAASGHAAGLWHVAVLG